MPRNFVTDEGSVENSMIGRRRFQPPLKVAPLQEGIRRPTSLLLLVTYLLEEREVKIYEQRRDCVPPKKCRYEVKLFSSSSSCYLLRERREIYGNGRTALLTAFFQRLRYDVASSLNNTNKMD
jgi:hypothetical protein